MARAGHAINFLSSTTTLSSMLGGSNFTNHDHRPSLSFLRRVIDRDQPRNFTMESNSLLSVWAGTPGGHVVGVRRINVTADNQYQAVWSQHYSLLAGGEGCMDVGTGNVEIDCVQSTLHPAYSVMSEEWFQLATTGITTDITTNTTQYWTSPRVQAVMPHRLSATLSSLSKHPVVEKPVADGQVVLAAEVDLTPLHQTLSHLNFEQGHDPPSASSVGVGGCGIRTSCMRVGIVYVGG